MHHSLIDGVSGMKLLQRAMSPDRENRAWAAALLGTSGAGACAPQRRSAAFTRPTRARISAAHAHRGQRHRRGVQAVAARAGRRRCRSWRRAFGKILGAWATRRSGMAVPFDAPRRCSTAACARSAASPPSSSRWPALRALAEAAGCTLNDVVLAVCGGALRRFLLERGSLPDKPLTAGIPVSVRPQDDEGHGNAISFIVATLGTDIEDPASGCRRSSPRCSMPRRMCRACRARR
jgi:diacylglycerol O-acyltransferase